MSTEGGRIRFWGLFLAAGLMMLGLSGLALVDATYEGRAVRGASRTPHILQQGSADTAVALWAWGNDDVAGRQHSVTYVEPLVQNAPLPPGLSKWPEPGEAVLSPALIRAGEQERVESRYGKLAGTIGKEGLQAPEERFAYVRPRANLLDKRDMYPLKGFGVPAGSAGVGESMSIPDLSVLAAGVAGFVLLPTGALVLVSARAGSTARERRLTLFEALGASRGARGIFTLGEGAVPTVLGAAAAAAWVRLLGLIGACLTVLAIGISALAEFLRFGRDMAPLSVLTGSTRVNGSVVAWSLLFPALLAAALGSIVSMWLTTPVSVDGGAPVPWDTYVLLGVGAGVCAAALCAWGWRSTNRAALRWRPTLD
ncbi:hypothetical protein [Streptomyces phaeochromogenes]|uniref:hypothetical protein n=1 Tax=Streptomyces phaeochromogenes TaxID=1923 RepID=UPI0037214E0B